MTQQLPISLVLKKDFESNFNPPTMHKKHSQKLKVLRRIAYSKIKED